MFGLLEKYCKKPIKTVDMKTGELIAFQPVSIWTKAKTLNVDVISGSCNHYENVEFKTTDKALIINDKNLGCIVYNLENVFKYSFQ